MSRKKINFIEKARLVHGDKYDYSETVYTKMHDKVKIICPIHGMFEQEAHAHLKGQGCPKCGLESRAAKRSDTLESFIEKAKSVHGSKYNYSKVEYNGSQEKVCIICPEHGEFWQKPYSHIQGQGCPKCKFDILATSRRDTKESFINKSKTIHGNKYDYSKVNYINSNTKVCIICPEHGPFWQKPNLHLRGHGCPKCGVMATHILMSNNEFIEKARLVHGDKYDYSRVIYKGPFEEVEIICPKHGSFMQKASYHLSGNGCKKCAVLSSKWETEVFDYINSLCNEVVRGDRIVLNGSEIDIYVPEKKVGFECDGLYWHNEINKEKNYHLDKTKQCDEKGIRLIHIFEDEWINKRNIVEGRIKSILGKEENRIYARNCTIKEVSYKVASEFLDENHIQGKLPFKIGYGLYFNESLVSLMTFGSKRKNMGNNAEDNEYELLRFCSKINTSVVGGAGKLFKHFLDSIKPKRVISYCDLRWGNGKLYEKLGFNLDHISQPNYFYVIGNKRKNRFNFRKDKLISEGFNKKMTEHEIMLSRGIYRIYDCGCKCYKYET